jgi:hypothetical protein
MSRTSKHQANTPNGDIPGPSDKGGASEEVLSSPHPAVLDADGGIAVDGGSLPGAKDDFEGETDGNGGVPGAHGPRATPPPNEQDIKQ